EEALQWKWERLDPVQGLMRLFSLRASLEGAKAVVKMVVILTITYFLLREQIAMLPRLMSFSIAQIFSFLGIVLTRLLTGVGFFMLGLAGLDYFYQRWDLEKEM